MQQRHQDKDQYFNEQDYTTRKYVVPYVSDFVKVDKSLHVLEIGCGEAGNLKPFLDLGCRCVGVDMNEQRIEFSKHRFANHPNAHLLQLVCANIYEKLDEYKEEFDLIILRDVIEHIHDQEKFLHHVKKLLKPTGRIFFGFPPWQNPFGGHQQICHSKFLSVLPFFHLLPNFLYVGILKLFGESPQMIADLLEIKQTGLSIERFERILNTENWKIDRKTFYFINPNYEVKFKLKQRITYPLLAKIPVLRNFWTTACYYLISKK